MERKKVFVGSCCDLLLNLYLWHIKHTVRLYRTRRLGLWFAFEFVSLTYQTHHLQRQRLQQHGCDLLLNLYLWHIKHTFDDILNIAEIVVICFWICIFDISNTPHLDKEKAQLQLWFAFEFVSLTYQTHLSDAVVMMMVVVICFWICIFDISNTPQSI